MFMYMSCRQHHFSYHNDDAMANAAIKIEAIHLEAVNTSITRRMQRSTLDECGRRVYILSRYRMSGMPHLTRTVRGLRYKYIRIYVEESTVSAESLLRISKTEEIEQYLPI